MNEVRPSYDLPFAGLKVLDLGQGIAGPYCAMLLAQHGAEVIKVEPPQGDWSRNIGKRTNDHTACELSANRGKRSIALDLSAAEGRALLARLGERCDVLIENFRPGVAERLGVGYDAVRTKNPKVIFLSVSGFGSTGPARDRPATDTVIQAFSGMMMTNRDASGTPRRTGFLAVDFVAGLYAFQAVSVALFARPFEAEGRYLEVPLVQATAAYLNMQLIEARLEGEEPRKLNVPAGTYRTKDGWIAVTLTKDEQFVAICEVLGRSDLGSDPRFADFSLRAENEAALLPGLREAFLARTTGDWFDRLTAADVFCSPVNSLTSWLDDPHVRAAGFAVDGHVPGLPPIPWARLPGAVHPGPEDARSRWPHIGEHGREILAAELGLSDAEIQGLIERAVLSLPQRR